MGNFAQDALSIIEDAYGGQWDCWWVPSSPSGYTWHARPKGTDIATLNANSPEELVDLLAEAERRAVERIAADLPAALAHK